MKAGGGGREGKDKGHTSDCPGWGPPGAPKAGGVEDRGEAGHGQGTGHACCLRQEESAIEHSVSGFLILTDPDAYCQEGDQPTHLLTLWMRTLRLWVGSYGSKVTQEVTGKAEAASQAP